MAQVHRLGPNVCSRLVLLCIHRVNRVNSRNDSWCQHHEHSTLSRYCYKMSLLGKWSILAKENNFWGLEIFYAIPDWLTDWLYTCPATARLYVSFSAVFIFFQRKYIFFMYLLAVFDMLASACTHSKHSVRQLTLSVITHSSIRHVYYTRIKSTATVYTKRAIIPVHQKPAP